MKKFIIVLFCSLFLFSVGCNIVNQKQEQELHYINKNIDEYKIKFDEAMKKYDETKDKKYLDEAKYNFNRMKEYAEQGKKYLDE